MATYFLPGFMSSGLPRLARGVTQLALGLLVATGGMASISAGQTAQISGVTPRAGHVVPGLQEDGSIVGVPTVGGMAVEETVEQIMARAAVPQVLPNRPWNERDGTRIQPILEPASPVVSRWPLGDLLPGEFADRDPQPIALNFSAINQNECGGIYPPDTMGDVSPTQILVCLNGRIKVFNKSGLLGPLNVDTAVFFASVTGSAFVADPRVVWDRTTNRWFITMITTETPNRLVLAVSSGAEITGQSSFRFFVFRQDQVGGGTTDNGRFADYPSMGVDANGVYIGVNMFAGNFAGTTAYVIRKSSVLATGPIVVTAFRGLVPSVTGVGIYAPRGVTNSDPAATEGYFIGNDNITLGRLVLRRVTNVATAPVLSPNINITVPSTARPVNVPALGSSVAVEVTNDRLFDARIYRNRLTGQSSLWTAHAIRSDIQGVANVNGDRDSARWYELNALDTATPTLVQSGTLVSPLTGNNRDYYFFPSVAMSGQGHMALGCAVAGPARRLSIAMAGRLASDQLGTIRPATVGQTSTANYTNDTFRNRWGDYSSTIVDPSDDMTMWTFQMHVLSVNVWNVRTFKLLAPPPVEPTQATPAAIAAGATTQVLLSGVSASGSGFFDTEPGMNRLTASVDGGGVTVDSVEFVSPTQVRLALTVAPDAQQTARRLVIRNPDGQESASGAILTIGCEPPSIVTNPVSVARACPGSTQILSVQASGGEPRGFQWRLNSVDLPLETNSTLTIANINKSDEGQYDCVVTNPCGNVTSLVATVGICAGDTDCSGSTDGDDVILFFQYWDAGDLRADVDGTQQVDGDDVIVFFGGWDNGC